MQGLIKRLSFLAIVMVVAIGTLGAAYTLWYEDLELHADVSTGTLTGEIVCATNLDNENPSWPAPPSSIDPFEQYPKAEPLKDVATDLITHQGDTLQEWVLEVGNTYPGYMFDCELHIANTGTVPWHVEIVTLEVMLPNGDLVLGSCEGSKCTLGDKDPITPGLSPIYVEIANFEGCQVHAEEDVNASLFVGVNQSAEEGSLYKVWLTYRVNQWNESTWNDCRDPRTDPIRPVLPPS